MRRVLAALVPAFIIAMCSGLFSALGEMDGGELPRVPFEASWELLQKEEAVAKELGFETVSRGNVGPGTWMVFDDFIPDNTCSAIVVTVHGPRVVPRLVVKPADDGPDVTRSTDALNVSHAQWCVTTGQRVRAKLELPRLRDGLYEDSWSGDWLLLQAPLEVIGGPQRLNRGWVPIEVVAEEVDAGS